MKNVGMGFLLSLMLVFSVFFTGCDDPLSSDAGVDPSAAVRIRLIDTDKQPGEVGGYIVVGRAEDESAVVRYLVYWGNSSFDTIGDPICTIDKNGSDLIYFIAENTVIPSEAEYLLAYSELDDGSLTTPVYTVIEDNDKYKIYSVFEIQNESDSNHPSAESDVTIQNVIVTAIKDNGSFWVQEPEISGYEYSGIFVDKNSIDIGPLAVGDVVTISGEYTEFYGLSEITLDELLVLDTGEAISPIVVDPSDIATGGVSAEIYEGVLLKIENVSVTNDTPDDPDKGEFVVTGGLRVDDEIFPISPDPVNGDTFSSITGILTYSWNNSKLLPREAADVQN